MLVMNEMMDRHELNRCNAEPGEIVDACMMAEARVSPTQVFGNGRILNTKALYVDFIDDRLVRSYGNAPVALPVKMRIMHDAFWHERCAITFTHNIRAFPEHIRKH